MLGQKKTIGWATLIQLMVAVGSLVPAAGCGNTPSNVEFVARVGNHYLSRDELNLALKSNPIPLDTVEASRQIIDQWVTNELLYQEAQRKHLYEIPHVKKLLHENERSVLISAYINRLYAEHAEDPPAQSIEMYFDQHKDQLKLREPFVRVRYLSQPSVDSARVARRLLQASLTTQNADSAWAKIASRFADDADGSLALDRSFFPVSRLFNALPSVQDALRHLSIGHIAPLIFASGTYHVLQLVDKKPTGSLPEIAWVEQELKERLAIEARKQMYARQVQRLKNEAIVREDLEIK